jgi:hypothetical protein
VHQDGQLLARRRISDDAAGLAVLLGLLAEHGDSAGDPVPVAIETPRGLLAACLRATGRSVYPINPMAVARYRDRHSIAGRKSDHGDAVVLANILRTDLHAHPPLPDDSELAQAIAVLARAQQDVRGGADGRAEPGGRAELATCRKSAPAAPGNLAAPVRAWVIRVFSRDSSSLRSSRRNAVRRALISSASAFGPVNPRRW